jgi:branched-chain amino acid transport system ATP-binding protein
VHKIVRGHASLVPEGRRLFLNQTVEDDLLLGALHLRRDRRRVRELLDSVYGLFSLLRDVRGRSSSALSGGQQQIVAIARMLMSDPQVLLLDEPSLGLAPIAIDGVASALAELRQRGRSLLLVEQRVDLALRVCDRVNVLAGGEIALEERASEIHAEERSLINAYLGRSGARGIDRGRPLARSGIAPMTGPRGPVRLFTNRDRRSTDERG